MYPSWLGALTPNPSLVPALLTCHNKSFQCPTDWEQLKVTVLFSQPAFPPSSALLFCQILIMFNDTMEMSYQKRCCFLQWCVMAMSGVSYFFFQFSTFLLDWNRKNVNACFLGNPSYLRRAVLKVLVGEWYYVHEGQWWGLEHHLFNWPTAKDFCHRHCWTDGDKKKNTSSVEP